MRHRKTETVNDKKSETFDKNNDEVQDNFSINVTYIIQDLPGLVVGCPTSFELFCGCLSKTDDKPWQS